MRYNGDDEERIKNELQRSMNILELNNDLETSRSIYENVKDGLVGCLGSGGSGSGDNEEAAPPIVALTPQSPMVSPSGLTIEFIIIVPAIISVIFGIKWYRSRKEVDVSNTS